MAMFKNCTEMFKTTTAAAPQQPMIAAPPPKPVQVTDMEEALKLVTLEGLNDMYWPGEKLMLKLEAAPKGTIHAPPSHVFARNLVVGKFIHIDLAELARPTWSTWDANTAPKSEGEHTL